MVHAPTTPPLVTDRTDDDIAHGARLVDAAGRALPLEATSVTADAKGGLARVVLRQTFANRDRTPVHVHYLLPLPADGAVSGFSFLIGDNRVVGQIDTKQRAQARYDEALIEGRTAALLAQTRSSVFRQAVGNIPPETRIEVEIVVDQPLRWLADDPSGGAWEWRFPTVVGPRYLGHPGRIPDPQDVQVAVSASALAARMTMSLAVRDALAEGRGVESPSHRWSPTTETGSGSPMRKRADSTETSWCDGRSPPPSQD